MYDNLQAGYGCFRRPGLRWVRRVVLVPGGACAAWGWAVLRTAMQCVLAQRSRAPDANRSRGVLPAGGPLGRGGRVLGVAGDKTSRLRVLAAGRCPASGAPRGLRASGRAYSRGAPVGSPVSQPRLRQSEAPRAGDEPRELPAWNLGSGRERAEDALLSGTPVCRREPLHLSKREAQLSDVPAGEASKVSGGEKASRPASVLLGGRF